MRVVVADDEPLVRSYLRSLVAEALPSGATVLEAGDGNELARLVIDGRADAAFVDIRMPKMDGFAAVDAIREAGRRIPWFVLTSHSDFSYAKRALELGASGYTLKPPSPEEIQSALAILREAVSAERAAKSDRFEHDWALFVGGHSVMPPDAGRGAAYSVGLVVTDGDIGAERVRKRSESVCRAVAERARRFADEGLWAAETVADGEIAVLTAVSDPGAFGSAAKRFWNEAALVAELEYGEGGSARSLVLTADVGGDAAESRRFLSALRTMARRRAFLPAGMVELSRAEGLLSSCTASEIFRAETADALVRCLRQGDGLGLAEASRSWFSSGGESDAVDRFLERYLGAAVRSLSESALLAACEALIGSAAPPSRDRDTIAAVEEYVRRRYSERIGVEGIARVFGLTPNYLSALFHKRTGRTLVQHVTELRLLRARELLREGLQVKETAWAVGYGSERHFARLYRGRFGHAPAVEKRNAQRS